MKQVNVSIFAERINSFVAQKLALGYEYRDSFYRINNFAKFAANNFPNETQLTKEMVLSYCVLRDGENSKTLNVRISILREFARYLISIGEDAYIVPSSFIRKESAKPPHIYSLSEISALWSEFDKMSLNYDHGVWHIVIPAIFRTVYCCGLRPSEPLRLRVEDVDLRNGTLNIVESKGHKSRIVTMPDDLRDYCIEYDSTIKKILPTRMAFFPNNIGKKCCYQTIWQIFKEHLTKAGISDSRGGRPRIYDFRHSFATHRLYIWMKEGKDLNAMMPYLSAYMGHSTPSVTHYYIHFVPGLLEDMTKKNYSDCQNLLPEVSTVE